MFGGTLPAGVLTMLKGEVGVPLMLSAFASLVSVPNGILQLLEY